MTRPGHHPIGKEAERRIARLMQLHVETHPKRVAQKVGLSAKHIRRLWGKFEVRDMPPAEEALEILNPPRPPDPQYGEHASPGDLCHAA